MLNVSFFTGGIAETNGWLVETAQGAVVFDAPEGMVGWLKARGVHVAALVLTHQHFDHVQDAAALKAEHGCPLYAFSPYSRTLTLEDLFGEVTGMGVSVAPYVVDYPLSHESLLTLVGTNWELKHVPGHSPDSLAFYAVEPGLLVSGDALFAGSIGRTDFPGGSQQLLQQGIADKIMVLPDVTRVLPGHGPETSLATERRSNPYL